MATALIWKPHRLGAMSEGPSCCSRINLALSGSLRSTALQLSGHTHGGQIWPFGYIVGFVNSFLAGLYRYGDTQLYVSRGTGQWGPPMRLASPSEITRIVLSSA